MALLLASMQLGEAAVYRQKSLEPLLQFGSQAWMIGKNGFNTDDFAAFRCGKIVSYDMVDLTLVVALSHFSDVDALAGAPAVRTNDILPGGSILYHLDEILIRQSS
jgi:hypothetical protein